MDSSPPQHPQLDFSSILTESKRIINAHSRHFLALSVLFLLPLSFSLTVYPTLFNLLSQPTTLNTSILIANFSHQIPLSTKTLVLNTSFSVFLFLFTLFATGSITYSVFHGFYGRPVKLFSAIKSAFGSFVRLLVTVVFAGVIACGLILLCGLLCFFVIKGFELLGFDVGVNSPCFVAASACFGILLLAGLVYLHLNWSLACVIAVVESCWGLEPLKRSSLLMKGMKFVAFSLMLFFGFFSVLMVWITSELSEGIDVSDGWRSCAFALQIVITSTVLMLLFLYNYASKTVLYMYCKAVHGELAWEIVEEFAREYVSLPFDDEKVPHLVSVVYA